MRAWPARGAGYLVFHGPRAMVPDFFEALGFRCPERKGEADFLQEVGSCCSRTAFESFSVLLPEWPPMPTGDTWAGCLKVR